MRGRLQRSSSVFGFPQSLDVSDLDRAVSLRRSCAPPPKVTGLLPATLPNAGERGRERLRMRAVVRACQQFAASLPPGHIVLPTTPTHFYVKRSLLAAGRRCATLNVNWSIRPGGRRHNLWSRRIHSPRGPHLFDLEPAHAAQLLWGCASCLS